jgi:hypothetical protein
MLTAAVAEVKVDVAEDEDEDDHLVTTKVCFGDHEAFKCC